MRLEAFSFLHLFHIMSLPWVSVHLTMAAALNGENQWPWSCWWSHMSGHVEDSAKALENWEVITEVIPWCIDNMSSVYPCLLHERTPSSLLFSCWGCSCSIIFVVSSPALGHPCPYLDPLWSPVSAGGKDGPCPQPICISFPDPFLVTFGFFCGKEWIN